MRVLKIESDITVHTDLPEDAEIITTTMNDYMVTEYDQKFDMILCVHALQTLWSDQVTGAVKKLLNDLADYGEVHIHVPALEQAAKALLQNVADPVVPYMIWGSKDRPFHSGFSLLWLRLLIEGIPGARIRKGAMEKLKMTKGDKEIYAIEHVMVATIIRS